MTVAPIAPTSVQLNHGGAQWPKLGTQGLNRVALEVAEIEEAPAFHAACLNSQPRGESKDAAFVDLGLISSPTQ